MKKSDNFADKHRLIDIGKREFIKAKVEEIGCHPYSHQVGVDIDDLRVLFGRG